MRIKGEVIGCRLLNRVGLAALLGVAPGWAAPAPQVRKAAPPSVASAPPATTAAQPIRESPTRPTLGAQVKTTPKMVNPHAANNPAHTSMMATLRTQRQAADTERDAILASQRMASKVPGSAAGRTLPPMRTMGDPGPGTPGAGPPPLGLRGPRRPPTPGLRLLRGHRGEPRLPLIRPVQVQAACAGPPWRRHLPRRPHRSRALPQGWAWPRAPACAQPSAR